MDLKLTGKNLVISKPIREYVEKKLKILLRYLTSIEEIRVEITEEKSARLPKDRYTAQITLINKGNILRGEEKASNINLAIDKATKLLSHQIRRYKGKLITKGRTISIEDSKENEPGKRDITKVKSAIVRVKRFPVDAMPMELAAERMELLSHDFFLFINIDSGVLNLIYRRKAGGYGVIEPITS